MKLLSKISSRPIYQELHKSSSKATVPLTTFTTSALPCLSTFKWMPCLTICKWKCNVFPITTSLMQFYVKWFSGYIKIRSISCPLCKQICSFTRDRYTSPGGLLLKYYAIISFKIYFLNILALPSLITSLLHTDKQFLLEFLTHFLL